jgi:hypothetical protein
MITPTGALGHRPYRQPTASRRPRSQSAQGKSASRLQAVLASWFWGVGPVGSQLISSQKEKAAALSGIHDVERPALKLDDHLTDDADFNGVGGGDTRGQQTSSE